MPMVPRPRLCEEILRAGPLTFLHAPAGSGKSVFLEAAARGPLRLVNVPLGATEGHPALFVEAMGQGLRRAYPGTAVGAVRAAAALRHAEDPSAVLEKVREALGVPILTVSFDELEQLPHGAVRDMISRLVSTRSERLRLILSSRLALPDLVTADCAVMGPRSLGFTPTEVEQYIAAEFALRPAFVFGGDTRALARAIWFETGGWPALVAARLATTFSLEPSPEALVAAFGPVVDEALSHASGQVRFVLSLASVAARLERAALGAIAVGDMPGSPEARRRLLRLEPSVVASSVAELVREGLLEIDGEAIEMSRGLRTVLSARFHESDRGGWCEVNRRAAELMLTRQAPPMKEILDLLASAEERERLLELLGRHGASLELECEETGDNRRMLRWLADFEVSVCPYWVDVLAGLGMARVGLVDESRARLEVARDKLNAERRDGALWRWQSRIAEASSILARSRGDLVDARSFLLRGLDQLEQVKRRGLSLEVERAELLALELRMTIALAKTSRDTGSWEKTRDPSLQALDLLRSTPLASRETEHELEAGLLLGALAAGDGRVLIRLGQGQGDLAPLCMILESLVARGQLNSTLQGLRGLMSEAQSPMRELAALCLLRVSGLSPVSGSSDESALALEVAAQAGAAIRALTAPEVSVRRDRSSAVASDGWLSALALEVAAPGPGRQLDLAREAYRRVGARWDEARLLVLGAAALSRRVDDGDGELEPLVRAVDGLAELGASGGFAIPWGYAGRGEFDPERRVRTLLLAGLRQGQERTRALCKLELENLGVDTRVVTGRAMRPRPISGVTRRPPGTQPLPYVSTTRQASEGLSIEQYQQLVASRGAQALVVSIPEQLVLNHGRVLALGQKRVMLPLLVHLLRHHDLSFSMLELARDIWESPDLTPTVETKVKVGISRLRALLGKGRSYIITTRKLEAGEFVVAYQVAPQLNFQLVDHAPQTAYSPNGMAQAL
jgi:hypothetical protein